MGDNHTPEPWAVYDARSQSAGEGVYIRLDNSLFMAPGSTMPEKAANARRIVAAVNACAGIPTELLESGAVAALGNATSRWLDLCDQCDIEGGWPDVCPNVELSGYPCHWCEARQLLARFQQLETSEVT